MRRPRVIRCPEKSEQRGQQCQRDEDGNHDSAGGRQAHNGEKGDADDTVMPASAMNTVSPANTTALPAVPTAVATECSSSMPSASCCLWRELMNSA